VPDKSIYRLRKVRGAKGAEFEPLIAHNIEMLNITFSNKYQSLLENLLDATAEPPASPFAAQQIIIPSAAIQRNLELAIADRLGVCANVEFSYLGSWIWQQVGKVLSLPDDSPFAQETLVWRIRRILEDRIFISTQPRLAAYLENADAVMRYELAAEAASLMDQTMTYRPKLIEAWSQNKLICMVGGNRLTARDQQWQAELWRRTLHEVGSERHLAAILKKLESVNATGASALRQAEPVHLFCPSTIAPLHIDILNQLGKWMDLRLYVLNPCREYWFDTVDTRRLSYLATIGQADHHETGNRLLSAWGKQTQAMIDLLFEKTDTACSEHSLFVSNAEQGRVSLLSQVQDAILELEELPPRSIQLHDEDRSIEVHVCHSLTRELEVLQDQLLALFAGDNPPSPAEVLVVTPDLEQASPLIDAIFGTATPSRRIPYTITGRKNSHINPVASALLELLSLLASRFAASAVFNLLQQTVIAQRFDLGDTDLKTLHGWIAESGMRWGIDATHRQQLGLPENERNTFNDGMHRLFLGYALPSGSDAPFCNRLPTGNPEGSGASALGCFHGFMQMLADAQRDLSQAKTPKQWKDALLDLTESFMLPLGQQLDDWRDVQTRIRELCDNMQQGGGDHPITPDVVRSTLEATLDDPARGGVPFGVLTFTSMSSLRSLPYRVICVVGLNDGSFPSAQRPVEFDLLALEPKRGDRQRRNDERNLFLDLLLAAQERLYLSYTGRSVRDNSPMPPSVLISDLLDYVGGAIEGEPNTVRQRLVVEHPLQAFAMGYFQQGADARLASSNDEYFRALKDKLDHPVAIGQHTGFDDEVEDEVISPQEAVLTFFDPPQLDEPGEEWREVSLDQLIRFFSNPSRYLLQQRLGIVFPEKQEELEDDEAFLPGWQDRSALAERLLPLYLRGADEDEIQASAMAGTEYPAGEIGKALLQQEMGALESFSQELMPELSEPMLPPCSHSLDFTIDRESWCLNGTLGELRTSGLLGYRYSDLQARDYLSAWIKHLFLNLAAPDGVQRTTVWHARDEKFTLPPVDDAQHHLQGLIELYRAGLTHPLRFYPRTSWEYIVSDGNVSKARSRWQNWKGKSGEGLDPSYRQALRGAQDPLNDEFEACAEIVFGRLSELLKEAQA